MNLYCSYDEIKKEKLKCIPTGDKSGIIATDYSAEVNFSELVTHTAERVALASKFLDVNPAHTLSMKFKAGFDGSTGNIIIKNKIL